MVCLPFPCCKSKRSPEWTVKSPATMVYNTPVLPAVVPTSTWFYPQVGVYVTPATQATPLPVLRTPREDDKKSRPTAHNPGVDLTPNRFLHPLPTKSGRAATAGEMVNTEQVSWQPINPAVGNAFIGTSIQSGTQILAMEDNNAPPLGPTLVYNATSPDGRPTVVTTPATRPYYLPTPSASPVSPPVIPTMHVPPLQTPSAPPRATPHVGTTALFPAQLPPGSRVMGVPDPSSPSHFWVQHPGPGPHANVAATTPAVIATPAATPFIPLQTPVLAVPTVAAAASPWVQPAVPAWVTQVTPTVMLNPHLCVNNASTYQPPLVWDLAHLPSTATLRHITGRNLVIPMKDKDLKDAAVYPPGMPVHIHLNHSSWPYMVGAWGPIVANPHGKDNIVTVLDVFDAVHKYLQEQLDWQEFASLSPCGPGDENSRRLKRAFKERCRTADALEEYELSQGLKRIDILGDERRWCGLTRVDGPGGTVQWSLILGSVKRFG